MKGKVVGFMVCFVLTAVTNGLCGATPDMQPGLWEVTTQAKMEGSFAMNMPATTTRQCLTREDYVPRDKSASGNGECEFKNVQVSNNTVTWIMECPTEGMHAEGRVVYSGDTFDGTMVMEMKQQQMRMTSTMKGKRIGDCP